MEKNYEELIAQFMEVSGSTKHVAQFYLSSSNWSVEDALSNYLSSQQEPGDDMAPSVRLPRSLNLSDLQQTVLGFNTNTTSTEDFGRRGGRSSGSSRGSGRNGGGVTTKPKIATLKDMKQNEETDEDEGQAFYAGGSDRSGQQVLGPPKRKDFREQLTEIFRLAQQNMAMLDSNQQGAGTSGNDESSGNNWGQGIRLGMTNSDHSVVSPENPKKSEKPVVILRLWSQGFTIDDEELRSYDDPQNKEFLQTVMRGEIPQELRNMGYEVHVDVEDHRFEEYRKPKAVVKTFRGSGQTLGSPVPNITENSSQDESKPNTSGGATNSSSAVQSQSDQNARDLLKVDSSAPTTNLQIRLTDGSRLAGQFNLTHTVADIYSYIQTARPQYANSDFILVSSFPTRELNDHNMTIEKADLKNAALMQRLK